MLCSPLIFQSLQPCGHLINNSQQGSSCSAARPTVFIHIVFWHDSSPPHDSRSSSLLCFCLFLLLPWKNTLWLKRVSLPTYSQDIPRHLCLAETPSPFSPPSLWMHGCFQTISVCLCSLILHHASCDVLLLRSASQSGRFTLDLRITWWHCPRLPLIGLRHFIFGVRIVFTAK